MEEQEKIFGFKKQKNPFLPILNHQLNNIYKNQKQNKKGISKEREKSKKKKKCEKNLVKEDQLILYGCTYFITSIISY